MGAAYFITGTDTGVGKTFCAAALLACANNRGLTTAAVKPVAAGCELTDAGWRNDDAVILRAIASVEQPYEEVNPVTLADAVAPHIAAGESGLALEAGQLAAACNRAMARGADITVIEGAGGWRVPLNDQETFADIPRLLGIPVIMVVGMRLGCINHAMLTAEAIARDGLELAGWIANCIDPEISRYPENVIALKNRLPAPLLGEIPFLPDASPEVAAAHLHLPGLDVDRGDSDC